MALSAEQIDAVARALLAARSSGESVPPPPLPLDDARDAYRIQQAVAQRHGAIEGWKVGAKGPEATPTCAPLLGGTVIERCDGLPCNIVVKGRIGVEVEIAYRIGRDFAAGSVPRDEEVLAAASAHIAVELCTSRLTGGAELPPLWLLADNQMNERLVIGPRLASGRGLRPTALAARLAVDGKVVASTIGGHPARDPLRLLVWLVRNCTQHWDGVRSGQIITTGSWSGMAMISPPAQISAEFAELGSLAFNISDH
jgi:2-keto-4-pentenoate hydratase